MTSIESQNSEHFQAKTFPSEFIFEGVHDISSAEPVDVNRLVCVSRVTMTKLKLVNFQWISILPSSFLSSVNESETNNDNANDENNANQSSNSTSSSSSSLFKYGYPVQVVELSTRQLEIYKASYVKDEDGHDNDNDNNNLDQIIFLTPTCLYNLQHNKQLLKYLYSYSTPPSLKPFYLVSISPVHHICTNTNSDENSPIKLSIKEAKIVNLVRIFSTFNSENPLEFSDHSKTIDKSLHLYFEERKYVSIGDIIQVKMSSTDLFSVFYDPRTILYLQVQRIEDKDGNEINISDITTEKNKEKEEATINLYSVSASMSSVYLSSEEINLIHPGIERDFVPSSSISMANRPPQILPVCIPLLQNYLDRLSNWLAEFTSVRSSLQHKHTQPETETEDELWPTCLLTGVVGSGKYTLVKSFAIHHGFNFHCVNFVSLMGDTSAFTIAKLTAVFHKVKSFSPCVLLIKNIHFLGKDKEGNEDKRVAIAFKELLQDLIHLHFDHRSKSHKQKTINKNSQVYVIGSTDCIEKVSTSALDSFIFHLSIEPSGDPSQDILEYVEWMVKRQPNLRFADDFSLKQWIEKSNARTVLKYLGDLKAFLAISVRKAYIDGMREEQEEERGKEILPPQYYHTSPQPIVIQQSQFDAALEELEKDVRSAIGSPKIPTVKWEDVGGLAEIKTELIDSVQLPLRFPHLFTSGLKRSGILLYGPPGTGKTLLAKAVASEFKINFFSVKGPELLNMYVGQSEQNVRDVFEKARESSPCVLFFDELDSLAPNRGKSGDSGGVMDRVVSQILAEMDGTHSTPNVFIIGATNRPDLIDPALLRPGRFDKLVYVGITEDRGAIQSILKALTRKFNLCQEVNLSEIAEKLPLGMSGADLYSFCSEAYMNAISRRIHLLESGASTDMDSPVAVTEQDFIEALNSVSTSLSKNELKKYENLKTMMR